jgi:hypothetical protein
MGSKLDYYFAHDHKRRVLDLVLASALGSVALFSLRSRATSEALEIGACIFVVLATFIVRLYRYSPGTMIAPSTRRKTIAPGEYIYRRSLPSRRLLIVELSASFWAIALFAFLPRPTIAEVVHWRLKRLLADGKDQEASDSAQEAIEAGVPLRPDVVRAAGITRTNSFEGISRNVEISSSLSPIPVELDTNAAILIRRPTVYFPAGKYLLNETVAGFDVSWNGDGPEKSIIMVGMEGDQGSPTVLNYSSYRKFDTLISNVGFDTPTHQRTRASALTVMPSTGRLVLSNVSVNSVSQRLDDAIWIHVQFNNCTIELGGDQFELAYVSFEDCDFKFADNIAAGTRELLRSNGLRGRMLAFRP